jgi:hypothetical protein
VTSILDLPHGLHAGYNAVDYHAKILGLVNNTALGYIAKSPAHYRAYVDGLLTDDETPALAFGTAFHAAMLEPDRFDAAYVVQPDFGDCRFKEAKANRDAWRSAHTGSIVIDQDDMKAIHGMRASIARHPIAGRLLEGGDAEVTMRWTDKETGIECKARADYYVPSRRLCVDLKTIEDASGDGFRRSVARYAYHRQAAHYLNGLDALGLPVDFFLFLVVEKSPPYDCVVYTLDNASLTRGRQDVERAMTRLAECLATDRWPGYSDSILSISVPTWT